MKKKYILKGFAVAVLIVAFFAMVVLCGDSDTNQVAHAQEITTDEDLFKQYTGSDSPNGLNLYDYVADYNNKKSLTHQESNFTSFASGTYFQNNMTYSLSNSMVFATVNGDDNIVKIIPRSLFVNAGTYFYVGYEYGFFVNTTSNGTYNTSSVIIFDVIRGSQNDADFYIDITIKPVMRANFCYVNNQSSIQMYKVYSDFPYIGITCSVNIENQDIQNAVIPLINCELNTSGLNHYKFLQYVESNSFKISDISFAASLYNVNSLNIGDTGYSVDEDYGYFFTGNSYHYSASHIESADVTSGIKDITSSITSAVLGYVPFLGDAISVADNLFTLASGVNALSSQITYNTTNENFVYPDLALYNTRATQKQHYNTLVKGSEILINSPDSERLYFMINDYARGTFNFSHTDKADGSSAEYNQLKLTVAMKIYNASGGLVDYFISDNLVFDINAPNTTAMQLFDDADFYITPGGAQSFSFVPPYNAKYDFVVPTGCDLYVDNVKVTAQNGKYQKVLPAGQACAIELKNVGNTLAYGGWSIDVADSAASLAIDNTALPYNGLYMTKYVPSQSGVYNISNSSTAKIDDVYVYNPTSQIFTTIMGQDAYVSTSDYNVFLSAGVEYYVVIKKTQDVSTSVSLNIAPLTNSLSMGTNTGITLVANDNFKYFKFVVPNGSVQDYSFIFTGMTEENDDYYFRLLDGNGNVVPTHSLGNGYLKAYSLAPNSTYYVGVKANIAKTCSVEVTATPITLSWKIYENGTLIHNSSALSVSLNNNASYTFELWINNAVKTDKIILISDSVDTGIDVLATGEVYIAANRLDGTSFTVGGTDDDVSFILTNTLEINVVYNTNQIIFSNIDYANKTLISWTAEHSSYQSFTYSISGINEDGNSFSKTETITGTSIDILPYLVSQGALEDVTFSLTKITITSALSASREIQISNKSVDVNCLYSHTESEKLIFSTVTYYQIANELHLHNLRHDLNTRKRLDNDINVTNRTYWTPIPLFQGFLYGGGYKISGIRIHIFTGSSSPQNIGFIGQNEGGLTSVCIDGIQITSNADTTTSTMINVGGLVGKNTVSGVISACEVTGSIYVNRVHSYVGGIIGYSDSNFGPSECVFGKTASRSTIKGYGYVGGIIGYTESLVDECQVINTDLEYAINAYHSRSIGGIAAYGNSTNIKNSTITNSSVKVTYGSTSFTDAYPIAGYIIGYAYATGYDTSTVVNCTNNKTSITNKNYCFDNASGGLFGYYVDAIQI